MKKKTICLIFCLLVISIIGFNPMFVKGEEESSSISAPTIYAGTSNPGYVYKYTGDTSWEIISPSLGFAVLCLVEYKESLYVGTETDFMGYSGVGRVYRYDGGTTWTLVGDNMGNQVCDLIVYQGDLYAGTAWGGMKLYRFDGENSWTQVIPSPIWSGTRALYESHGYLLMGDMGYDRFGRWDGSNFYADLSGGGSCIYDYQEYDGNIFGAAYLGRLWQSPDAISWSVILGYDYNRLSIWELEKFQNQLYMSYDNGELRAGTMTIPGDRGNLIFSAPDGIISMTTNGNDLYFGTGGEAGALYFSESNGIAGVYKYDGISPPVLISGIDQFGGGVQELYIPPRSINKMLSALTGELGDIVHTTINLNVPVGETVILNDNLPEGFEYIKGSFMINGIPAATKVKKGILTYEILDSGFHVLEFDVKIDQAKNWEDMEICNVVTATWYFNGDNVDEMEDIECFIIHPFEELSKRMVEKKVYWEDYHDTNGDSIYGNCKVFAEALSEEGFILDEISHSPINYATLSEYNILVINDPEIPLSGDEIVAIDDWLEDGGNGLFIIGEWYGAFDIYSVNLLSTTYGAYFTYDYLNWPIINDLTTHPITNGITQFGPGSGAWGTLNVFESAIELAWADLGHTQCVLAAYEGPSKIVWLADSDIFWNDEIMQLGNMQLGKNILEWLDPEGDQESIIIKEKTETQWMIAIEVTNPFDFIMTDVKITDNFGAELEIDEPFPSSITHGTVSYYTKGRSEKVFLTWELGDLLPGETAKLLFFVSTDLNPAGKQEYTSPGVYELNSGATLKFIDPQQDIQLSAYTDSIYVNVLSLEDP